MTYWRLYHRLMICVILKYYHKNATTLFVDVKRILINLTTCRFGAFKGLVEQKNLFSFIILILNNNNNKFFASYYPNLNANLCIIKMYTNL
jgi:hypothetical protein